jgi:hypothetical protein
MADTQMCRDDTALTTINSPGAGTWQYANFNVSFTDNDTGGSGLATCYYRVNGVQKTFVRHERECDHYCGYIKHC